MGLAGDLEVTNGETVTKGLMAGEKSFIQPLDPSSLTWVAVSELMRREGALLHPSVQVDLVTVALRGSNLELPLSGLSPHLLV